jgi:hypothetical protein
MVKKKSRRSTSGEEMATALDRWDEEGGVQDVAWPLPYEAGELAQGLRARCLGQSHDAAPLKTRIARFLHDHKGASGT